MARRVSSKRFFNNRPEISHFLHFTFRNDAVFTNRFNYFLVAHSKAVALVSVPALMISETNVTSSSSESRPRPGASS
ncbi:hypothetical protein G4B88_022720 [Cannabis sativa]|uniref:Uncharacterized protein n=1 Tax=Cannabis sativa TaxID=3483 RepID=A0A7J6HWD5_CANSA|nr:hypothetical protein G4B88_022720 [Cannabis sativa]